MDGYLSKGILSNIKYRDTGFIQLPETTDSVKQTVRYVNIIAPGLLFALLDFTSLHNEKSLNSNTKHEYRIRQLADRERLRRVNL